MNAAELPQGAQKARAVREMFDRVAHRYDLVNRVMTFGLDVGWRRRAVAALRLPGGARVADLACGTGDLCTELGR
ncbi:MAG: class I SAM-dependent methyltransferase, partial [Actinomycetota bacterium]